MVHCRNRADTALDSVSEIYNINTTGQAIVFVAGLGEFLVSIWKSAKRLRPSDSDLERSVNVEFGTHKSHPKHASTSGDAKRRHLTEQCPL